MRRRSLVPIAVVALLLAACGAGEAGPEEVVSAGLPLCADVPEVSAPEEAFADEPVYVANEMPVDEVRAWASAKPGFEEIWIDREHNGWITVAFSRDAERRQEELREAFPGVGVVAVAVTWSTAELLELQQLVHGTLSTHFPVSTWTSPLQGVVGVSVGVMTPERVDLVNELFADEAVCIDGIDPADAPAPGPQAAFGDGWRLLVDEAGAGSPYRTGIAYDEESLRELWQAIGLETAPPPVDFQSEVVVWFGAVYGSSCPGLRLDDVVVDEERALLHAVIVLVDPPSACTSDANPRAYVVAFERSRLPAAPFTIQLGADDPPAGVPEERTMVDADLTAPASTAAPGEVHGDPSLPAPFVLEPGSIVEPDVAYPFRMYVHCGVEWLGEFNGVNWAAADVPTGDFVPEEWRHAVSEGDFVEVTLLLTTGPPAIALTAQGHTQVYHPTTAPDPGCD